MHIIVGSEILASSALVETEQFSRLKLITINKIFNLNFIFSSLFYKTLNKHKKTIYDFSKKNL
tara:strand:+ start:1369 stop:1557 length:189 start_codon:yes stop_codon:yes gene_type:complete